MSLLKNFLIRTVMLVILGLFCLMWASVGVYGVLSLKSLSEGNRVDRELVSQMTRVSQGNDYYFRFITRLSRLMESKAEGRLLQSADFEQVQAAMDGMTLALTQFRSAPNGSMEPIMAEKVLTSWQALLNEGVIPQLQLAKSASLEDFRQHARNITPVLSRAFGASVNEFNSNAANILDTTRRDVDQRTKRLMMVIVAAVLMGLAIFIFADRYMVAIMVKPLKQIRQQFDLIAKGDLSQPLPDIGRNCVGNLMPLLMLMQNSLSESIATIRRGTENIWRGAAEISAGNRDLSNRTEEQAAALEQTAASMEQLTATVKQNSDNARQASQLAENASDTASRGGHIVSDVVDTMTDIKDSSKKIADITSVINSIAFQTNILALNAAVEAARAGEQGRGFAVVASEVRNLAQRSAAAAKEIETLIADSVQRVEKGSSLVNDAGKTMSEILKAVTDVSVIMRQIAEASEEQSKGIEQMNIAISSMDNVTQQNASLVEEVSSSAGSLETQSDELQSAVARFRLHQPEDPANNITVGTARPEPSVRMPVVLNPMKLATGSAKTVSPEEWTSF